MRAKYIRERKREGLPSIKEEEEEEILFMPSRFITYFGRRTSAYKSRFKSLLAQTLIRSMNIFVVVLEKNDEFMFLSHMVVDLCVI